MERVYTELLVGHLLKDRQMLFLAGPRQVGKTTLSKSLNLVDFEFFYLNWDEKQNKQIILNGTSDILAYINLDKARKNKPVIIFDEIHKYKHWKNFLKGFYDTTQDILHIIVTGSAKLDIYRKGSDSLMGRYFLYRIHPFTVAEIVQARTNIEKQISLPKVVPIDLVDKLLLFGGYPDPFIRHDLKFRNRWQQLKYNQLFKEDLLELTKIHEIILLEQLAYQLKSCVGNLVNKDDLSKKLQVAATTIKSWLAILELSYYCFFVPPWSSNVARSILKNNKVYLWDWSEVIDKGQRLENLVASHLLKAIHFWTDTGFGKYDLYFIRNKDKQEVDFLVTENMQPWILVEVKSSDQSLSKSLKKFQVETGAKHAFQVVKNLPYSNINCFDYNDPVVVSLDTFLSQLV